ncbi:MAG: thioredoxin family protein, partial [Odoribacter sp.]|nr:thioredoxin family protein [Odoribacter sp.]
MRHISILLLCLWAWGVSVAQEGVAFRNITLDEAQEQAKAENKLVFMDCYTSWCGPCQEMTKKVFPQKAAGDYFNPRFVCVKYDMEKGAG